MIGGEFEIDINNKGDFFTEQENTYYYSSGRAALYQILKSTNNYTNTIFLPDYLCHTIVNAAKKAGFDYVFYELDNKLQVSPNSLEKAGFKNGNIILLINYFGLQCLSEISRIIKDTYPNSVIIEDDVQAFFSYHESNNIYADYRFTSLRKTFAVPDGGLVFTKNQMHKTYNANTFAIYKIKAGIMKFNRKKNNKEDSSYLELFDKGSMLIDDNFDSIMSLDSKLLYSGTNKQFARMRRQKNASYILHGLDSLNIKPILNVTTDSVPLFIPILLNDRDKIRKKMFENEIYCPIHWPLNGLRLKKGVEMAKHELSIIIDQRYSEDDMNKILEILNKQ